MLRVGSGVIRPRGSLSTRLAGIYDSVCQLMERFSPTCISLEKSFVGTNVQSAFRLGEARGVILAATGLREIPVHEYAPAEVKVAVTGAGRANKEQVQMMVARLLGVPAIAASDEADALATAICHIHRARFHTQISVADLRVHRSRPSRNAWTRMATARTKAAR